MLNNVDGLTNRYLPRRIVERIVAIVTETDSGVKRSGVYGDQRKVKRLVRKKERVGIE